jgi:hypothetical protein
MGLTQHGFITLAMKTRETRKKNGIVHKSRQLERTYGAQVNKKTRKKKKEIRKQGKSTASQLTRIVCRHLRISKMTKALTFPEMTAKLWREEAARNTSVSNEGHQSAARFVCRHLRISTMTKALTFPEMTAKLWREEAARNTFVPHEGHQSAASAARNTFVPNEGHPSAARNTFVPNEGHQSVIHWTTLTFSNIVERDFTRNSMF